MNDHAAQPLVSAIVSTYNSEFFIRGCIEDLERQSIARRLEIIVIDSASPQNEGAIVGELQERYGNIRYLRTERRETVYAAWNRAIDLARGRYLTTSNTDDRHRADAFELMVRVLDAHRQIDLVYGDILVTGTPNETFENHSATGRYSWYDWDRNILLDEGCFIGPQPMWRRSLHELYGGFDPTYVTSGDYEYWLRASQTSNFFHIREPLGLYLAHAESIEHRNTQIKEQEDGKILQLYRQAAGEGRLVGMLPMQRMRACAADQSACLPKLRIEQLVHAVEAQLPPQVALSDNQSRDYQLSKTGLFGNIATGADRVERFLGIAEALILNQQAWYRNRRSVEETTTDEPLLRLQGLTTALLEARQQVQRDDLDGAVSILLNSAINAAPASPVGYLELADLLLAAGRSADALKILSSIPPDADSTLVQERCSSCYAALGQDDAAREAAARAGNRPGALATLGTLAARSSDFGAAETFFRRAIEAEPLKGSAWLSLGMLLWSQGDQEGAYHAVRQAVVLDPMNEHALGILRDMAERRSCQSDLLQVVTEALLLYPESRNLERQRAQLLTQTQLCPIGGPPGPAHLRLQERPSRQPEKGGERG